MSYHCHITAAHPPHRVMAARTIKQCGGVRSGTLDDIAYDVVESFTEQHQLAAAGAIEEFRTALDKNGYTITRKVIQ